MGIVMTGSSAGGLGGGVTIRRPGALPAGVLPAAATANSPLAVGLAGGFGRNGILLAALTGEVIGTLLAGEATDVDLAPFAPGRAVSHP